MSKTYGTLFGMRNSRTTRGNADGVRASVQAYDGSVICENWYDEDKLMIRVGTSDDSSTSASWSSPEFRGTFSEFKDLLKLSEDIKSGRVSIVHHRNIK